MTNTAQRKAVEAKRSERAAWRASGAGELMVRMVRAKRAGRDPWQEITMSYENAPATKMLATHCAACGRSLVDAVSVEVGMGPDCREKYMGGATVDEAARTEANQIVARIASTRSHTDGWRTEVREGVARLRALGFAVLADRILGAAQAKPSVMIDLDPATGELVVTTPYNEEFVEYVRGITGRRWDGERKANRFPAEARRELWFILQNCYAGLVGVGPKGEFAI